jgi:Na+/H+ antiporter NhaC
MVKISSIMILAFLMGHISAELNTGQYIASITSGVIPSGFAIGFIFLIAAVMSLATGTSWGTFAIMIPIGVQLGVSLGIDPHFMIGAAISGSIFGDMTSLSPAMPSWPRWRPTATILSIFVPKCLMRW